MIPLRRSPSRSAAPAKPPRSRPTRMLVGAVRLVLPVAILGGAWLAADRLVASRPEVARGERSEPVYRIETVTVARGDHRPTLRVYGEIVPRRVVELRALSPGEVVRLHPDLEVGATVAAGDELVAVDDFPYRGAVTEAKASLAEAKARVAEVEARLKQEETGIASAEEQLAFADRDLERAERLVRSGAITEQTLDVRRMTVSERRQALDQRRHALEMERARLDQQKAAVDRLTWHLDRAGRALRDTVLRAPFDGVVMVENAQIGRMLGANDVAVTLYEAGALDVRFTLSDRQYGRLITAGGTLEGTVIDVVWEIGDAPLTYTATVRRVGAEIAAARGGIDIYARLALRPGDVAPRPGAFVAVTVPGVLRHDSVRIPAVALFGDHVYTVADERLRRRPVELLALDGADAIVDGDLEAGERLLATRLVEAGDGVRVRDVGEVPEGAAATAEVQRGGRI